MAKGKLKSTAEQLEESKARTKFLEAKLEKEKNMSEEDKKSVRADKKKIKDFIDTLTTLDEIADVKGKLGLNEEKS